MKRFLFLAILFSLTTFMFADSEILVGTGSGIGTTNLSAWQVLYKTLPDDTLNHHLQRRTHRAYSEARGFNIWTFTESQFLTQLRSRTNPVNPAPTDLAAWDSLYTNVPTDELRHWLLQPVHEYYAARKGWQIYVRTEAAYIERLKTLLGQTQ